MTSGAGSVVVVGGTSGIGLELARRYATAGRPVVLTGRDAARAAGVAAELGGKVTATTFDLARPHDIAAGLAAVEGPVDHLVIAAIDRNNNAVDGYDVDAAVHLVTLKLVGYVEVIHALRDRLAPNASILLFGGQAKERPYPGSTDVTIVNGGVTTMVHTLAVELKPVRVNAIHPGIVIDSPYWAGKQAAVDRVAEQTPIGRGPVMADVVDACAFLLENGSVNAVNLAVDGGWLLG
jgi:NAD(P)-dependent dehydrogenase (short-subunit alcohol dehydrogenase family)